MLTPQIIEYIKIQLQAGITPEQIKEALLQTGWQQSDIDAAFATLTPAAAAPVDSPSLSVPEISSKPSRKKLYIGLAIAFILIVSGAAAVYAFSLTSSAVPEEKKLPASKPTPTQVVAVPTKGEEQKYETAQYVSPDNFYAFDYIKTWNISNNEGLTILTDPQNEDANKCDGVAENFEWCDIVISTVPYSGLEYVAEEVSAPPETSHEEQVKQLAAQLGDMESQPFTNAHGLKGYIVKTPAPEGGEKNTYNFLFEGEKNMIVVQMPIKSTESVTEMHKITVQSMKEP